MKKNKNFEKAASDFWMEDSVELAHAGDDIMELSSYRRAVANFVRIVTGDNISVRYSSGNQSYTDGKHVTISASTKLTERDSMVGLALHEGSHIKLTDFALIQRVFAQRMITDIFPQLERIVNAGMWSDWDVRNYLKDLHNYVEDRRIDHFVMRSAPGYRPYYQALYDRYFNAPIISKGLRSSEYREENWNSYLFRLLNITNPASDLSALRGLERIHEILDLKNVSRFKDTMDTLHTAVEIFEVIHDHVFEEWKRRPAEQESQEDGDTQEQQQSNGDAKDMSGDSDSTDTQNSMQSSGGGDNTNTDNDEQGQESQEDQEVNEGTDNVSKNTNDGAGSSGSVDSNHDLPSLSDKEQRRLHKQLQEQLNLQDGQLRKKKVSKRSNEMINAIDDSDIVVRQVNVDNCKYNVIVVRKFNRRLASTVDCGMWSAVPHTRHAEAVNAGLIQGTILGKKLKVRAEERNTKFNRLRSGKIDKRMISQAGFGAEGIFQKIESFAYRPGIIHISIDNSGSMSGSKFNRSLTTATAIAKACSMIENMECVISFRSTGSMNGRGEDPMIVIAYDSRHQSIAELRALLPHMSVCGTTPEGLCFDAIMNEVLESAKGKDAYFVNFSDGAPYYYNRNSGHHQHYSGQEAYIHTRKQVNKMLLNGIKVISYFISDTRSDGETNAFTLMYGRSAEYIDVRSINQVAKTMNDKFLEVV